MIKREDGFTLTELMITMVVFVFVMAMSSQIFVGLLTQFKQQSRIAESNIEGIIGLDLMRRDIEHAGYGLPWALGDAVYSEAEVVGETPWVDRDFNDGPPTNPQRGICANTDCPNALPLSCNPAECSNPPAGIRSGNEAAGSMNGGSDVIIIKATNVATNAASTKWTHLFTGNKVTEWVPSAERFDNNDRVIVINPRNRVLKLAAAGGFYTSYDTSTDPDSLADGNFAPLDTVEIDVAYGISVVNPRMPFNRADFYVRKPTAMPSRCAIGNPSSNADKGTGILYKGTVNHADGMLTELPLLDCVANMQVVYGMDNDENGSIDVYVSDISALTAQQIRNRVKEVQIYILAHEGQKDPNFTYDKFIDAPDNTKIRVGQAGGLGRDVLMTTIKDYKNYRWKIYTMVIKPTSLR